MSKKKKFSTSSIIYNKDSNQNIPPSNEKTSSSTPATTSSSTTQQPITTVNVKVKPKYKSKSVDYSRSYTENNYITTVRAFNEYLLTPKDLEKLRSYKRRSPYTDYTNLDNEEANWITVYLRSDVREAAIGVWGSIENVAKEKERRRQEYNRERSGVFNLKKTLRDYQARIDKLEDPHFDESSYSNATIFKTASGKLVLTAIFINGANFIGKFLGWAYTGSSSLFAEAVHSLADTMNQMILLVGLHQSLRKPNPDHPYGYSNMTYITSLISGVGIFCFGTGLSFYHGIMGLIDPQPLESLYWALILLSGSVMSEGSTLFLAWKNTKKNAQKLGIGIWPYILQGYQPSVNVVLLEDIGSVSSVLIAITCMGISQYTGSPLADSIGSLLIGTAMGCVAGLIIYTNSSALVGRSIPKRKQDQINLDLEADVMVRSIHDVKATDMGGQTMFKAEVDLDGREITRSYLEKIDIEKLCDEMSGIKTPQEAEAFMLRHGENIVDRVGAEIDRIERNLKKKYPDITHVDLEVL